MDKILELLLTFRDIAIEHSMFAVGILLVLGYLLGIFAKRFRLPEITGFIIAGLLLGDTVFGVIHHEMGKSLTIVTEVALGLIALTIGSEFYITKLKKMGREVLIMTVSQLLLTFIAVAGFLFLFNMELPYSLMMGAIAIASAPAATVAIVQSLRAHGPFIDRLYGLVALDNAGSIIIFGIIFSLIPGMLGTSTDSSSLLLIGSAFAQILLSILLGGIFGILIHITTRKKDHSGELLILTLGFIFLETSIVIAFNLSPLLSNMAAGAIIINISPINHRLFKVLQPLTPPIYALFFALAGTELNPSILFQKEIVVLGAIFIIARAFGKYFGIYFGGILGSSDEKSRFYLGFCMIPQAGVAIGLILMIKASDFVRNLPVRELGIINLMVNIILLAVFINELVGPPITRYAIIKSLDIKEK